MLVVWLLAALALGGYEAFFRHRPQDGFVSLMYAFFPIAFALALYLYGALATVSFDDDGMRIRYGPFRRARVDFADIDRVKLETVEHLWQRSGRKSSRMIRSLYKQKSLCVQLKPDDRMAYDLARRLGARLVFDGDLVIPVTHVEDAMGAIKDGLVQQRAVAAVPRRGHRRGRRGRR